MRKKRNGFGKVVCKLCNTKSATGTFDFYHIFGDKPGSLTRRVIFLYNCTLCKKYSRSVSGTGVVKEITREDFIQSSTVYGDVPLED